jgi:hypothetical protein
MIYQIISLNQWFAKIGLFVDNAIIHSPFFGDISQNGCFSPNSPKILNGNFTFIALPINLLYFSKIFNCEIEVVYEKRSKFLNFSYEVFRRDYRVFFIPITFIPYRGIPREGVPFGGIRWMRGGSIF